MLNLVPFVAVPALRAGAFCRTPLQNGNHLRGRQADNGGAGLEGFAELGMLDPRPEPSVRDGRRGDEMRAPYPSPLDSGSKLTLQEGGEHPGLGQAERSGDVPVPAVFAGGDSACRKAMDPRPVDKAL
jgi:hypothetical protein